MFIPREDVSAIYLSSFDLLNFESFRSKRPIELEGLRMIFLRDLI